MISVRQFSYLRITSVVVDFVDSAVVCICIAKRIDIF